MRKRNSREGGGMRAMSLMGLMRPIRLMSLMGPIRLMSLMGPMGLMSLISLMGLMGCSEDAGEGIGNSRVEIVLRGVAPSFLEVEAVTRAVVWPDGYYDYDGVYSFSNQVSNDKRSIRAFFTQNGEEPQGGVFSYNAPKWIYSADIKKGEYFLYGFMPNDEVAGAVIEGYGANGTNGGYGEGAVLRLSGLNMVTPSDLCVIVGAKEGTGEETCPGLTTGQFATIIHDSSSESTTNYLFLLFDHIYAGLRFSFKVDATYNDLRTIKLKKLELKGSDGTHSYSKANAVITLVKNNTGSSPITNISITADATSSETAFATLFDETGNASNHKVLSTTASDFLGCFAPTLCNSFVLKTTYDVYDKNGNLVRKDCKAENKLGIDPSVGTLTRGEIYTINITVEPTYLYVLSEPDLDNPTIEIK